MPVQQNSIEAPTRVPAAISGVPKAIPFPSEQSGLSAIYRYRGNPLRRFSDMHRRYPEVAGFRILGQEVVALHDPRTIEEILVQKHGLFIKDEFTADLRTVLGWGLLNSEGELHKKHRKLIAPSFAATEVAQYTNTIYDCARQFAASLRAGEVRDMHAATMHLTLDILVQTLFGQQFDAFELVERELTSIMQAFRPWPELFRMATPDWVPLPSRLRLRRARKKLCAVVDRLISHKRAQPGGSDLLSRMLEAHDEQGSLSNEELRDQLITLLLAGHETTALSLTYALRCLSLNPQCRARVESELDDVLQGQRPGAESLRRLPYTQAVLEESLRLYPPAWAIGRQPVQDCVIQGWQFKKGQQIAIVQYTLHRDPRWFEEPEAFKPERFLPGGSFQKQKAPRCAYMPFGAGPRICVGNHFAILEAMVILSALLVRARFDCVPGAPFELTPSVTLRPTHPVPMRVSLRDA